MRKLCFALCAIIIACSGLAGCTKTDEPHSDPSCLRLTKIVESGGIEYIFEYDSLNRLAYRWTHMEYPALPQYKYVYDNQGRLSQMIIAGFDFAIGGGFSKWHFYYYDNQGRIAGDTCYLGMDGIIGPDRPIYTSGIPMQYVTEYDTFQYDAQNRIISETHTYFDGRTFTREFSYNAAGNRIGGGWMGDFEYDNKVNFNRTDPVLQFLHRDYSVNNLKIGDSYNAEGLPLVFPSNGKLHPLGNDWGIGGCTLTYACNPGRNRPSHH
ncbi:hypothetical protein [Chitinophaga rhizophila]|uniref:YD repeat-containing protein n=1 Tax=Chitinophaga rhizophila TaxID=2866212 RepID=A0ABS7GJP5_9BACT|nr:hypothetical protein [Chitinophaga rhizophila]MBW8687918.1 hypothetical protein [Chitinophaga rhizophila]